MALVGLLPFCGTCLRPISPKSDFEGNRLYEDGPVV